MITAIGHTIYQSTSCICKDKKLVVGIAAGYAPYISINEQGVYEGFDIDVMQAVAQQMGKKLELKDLGSMAPLMIALEQGSVDMIIWGLTITQARTSKFAMIHYQGEPMTTNPLVFWGNVPNDIATLDDMRGKKVCIEPSSIQADIITAYPDIIILPTEKVDDALLNLQYDKADAALLDPEIAHKFKNSYNEIKIIDIPLPNAMHTQGVGIALKKDDTTMINAISDAVTQLKADGIIKKYEQKWGLQ